MNQFPDPLDAITSLFWHSDHHDWAHLEAVFAEQVRLDYTALTGGEPATLTPAEVVAAWRPGFEAIDAHQHLVANHLMTTDADRATATASFIATHQWHGTTWTLGGDYRFELIQSDGSWAITAMTMTPVWQAGDPDLIATALAYTDEGAPRSAAEVAADFLERLGDLDIDGALANFANDAVQEMPYSPAGFPHRLDGIDAIRRQYSGLPDAYTSMHFDITATHNTTDPGCVILEYTGSIRLKTGGRYDNTYIGVFHTRNGRIVCFREYFNPMVLQAAFGDDVADTFSLDKP